MPNTIDFFGAQQQGGVVCRENYPPQLWIPRFLAHDPFVLPTLFQGKLAEAERLYERCQAIDEKVLGSEHPDFAITLNNRAGLLRAQVRAVRNFQEVS